MSELRADIAAALAAGGRRFTLVRAGGLGDTLLVLPALELVRQSAPGVQVSLVGSVWAERLVPLMGHPPHLVRFDSPELTPLFAPAARQDPSGAFARADAAVVYASASDDPLAQSARCLCTGPVVVWPVDPDGSCHAAAHFARAVASAPLEADALPPPGLRVAPELSAWASEWLEQRSGVEGRPLAVHPGSGGRRKCWPPERFAALIRSEPPPVLLVEGPADAQTCGAVAELAGERQRIVNATGLSVPQAAALLGQCRAYVGNDSGITHLAAALGVPTVAVFGPTDPAVWRPLGSRVQTVIGAGRAGAWPSVAQVRDALARASPASGGP